MNKNMTSMAGRAKGSHAHKQPTSSRNALGHGSIHGPKVILIEGGADEFVPNVERATGMHGFAIVVPPDQRDGWLLDMLWRITVAYAAMPSLLYSRENVRKMVEAVMSHEKRSIAVDKPKRTRASKRNHAG